MDRSFLSDAKVVAASRNFVCIRLATYEDQQEADFLTTLYLGRSGTLENTTFAMLEPDGQTPLTAAGRSPFPAYRSGWSMALGMDQIAGRYPACNPESASAASLPLMKNLDLALNVAAADGLPLLVSLGRTEEALQSIHETVRPLAWKTPLTGQFLFAAVRNRAALKPVSGVTIDEGILLIQPGTFGLAGKVLKELHTSDLEQKLETALTEVARNFPRTAKDHNSHVQLGIQLGIEWESRIPETDPMSVRARERARGAR